MRRFDQLLEQNRRLLPVSMDVLDIARQPALSSFVESGAVAALMDRIEPVWKQIATNGPEFSAMFGAADRLSGPWSSLAAEESMRRVHLPLTSLLGDLQDHPALSRMYATGDFGPVGGALTSILGHPAPQLPDFLSMVQLQAIRTSADEPSPIAHMVDRIGKGWASLGDRLIGGQVDLAPLMPPSNRLATRAYELDIVVRLDDPPAAEAEVLDTRRDNWDQVAEWLATINPRLAERWVGMWDRMQHRGADWQSQAANSAVELIDGLLVALAPNDEVKSWQAAKGAHHDLYQKSGTPTRRLRLLYLGAQFRVSRHTVDGMFHAVPGVIDELQGTKHGVHPDEKFEAGISLLGDVVAILVPNRRR